MIEIEYVTFCCRLIRHSLDRWLFGEDDTGDLTKPANMTHIIERATEQLGDTIQLVCCKWREGADLPNIQMHACIICCHRNSSLNNF